MLFDLPDHDTLYRALLERDARYDGQAYVCVSSTGIFCRLTCPARFPGDNRGVYRSGVSAVQAVPPHAGGRGGRSNDQGLAGRTR